MEKRDNSLFNVLSLNKEIDKRGKHLLKFPQVIPIVVREYKFEFEFPIKPNFHDYLEIICIINNRAIIQCGEKKYNVKKGDILIIRIAFLTGFNTLSFFNKTFKKYTRFTPSTYRKRLINNHP